MVGGGGFLISCLCLQISGVAGYIIGRRGQTVRDMERDTGARIAIDDATTGKEIASITASSKAVLDAAVEKVKATVAEARAAPARATPAFIQQIAVST